MNRVTTLGRLLAAAMTLATTPCPAAAPTETLREAALRFHQAMARPVIDYCVAAMPELEPALESEYRRYIGLASEAIQALAPEVGDSFDQPAPDQTAMADRVSATILEGVRQYPVHQYCPWLRDSLGAVTAETMRTRTVRFYRDYVEKSARHGPEAGR